ncbi:probable chitinase 2 [Neocloeon triangulifer]|uniref:probable chitinase 2 n=1 Tax=Neocloeon triangulifer TaxID=2078957 RepID=UPI00286F6E8D|nr:probable chitinase 2 [Neocloeon triangulifer]
MKTPILLAICMVLLACPGESAVICQLASWSVYRPGGGNFEIANIEPSLCTHGVYVFAGLDSSDQVGSLDPWADLEEGGGLGGYAKFVALKTINPAFKPMLALGGWANSAAHYAAIAANATRRANLATNVVAYLKKYGFEGVEIDWLYPITANDKTNFPLLLSELKSALAPEGFELIATVGSLAETIDRAYDIKEMEKSLDYFVLLGYDYDGPWNPQTGLNSPLYLANDNPLCVNASVNAFLQGGLAPGKLIVGIPGYGHTFTLVSEPENGIGADAIGAGDGGPWTQAPGTLSYNEFAANAAAWTVRRDTLSQAPYAYKGNQWLSIEDETSIAFKTEYIVSKQLGGAAFWTIDEDELSNQAYTLLRAINTGLKKK